MIARWLMLIVLGFTISGCWKEYVCSCPKQVEFDMQTIDIPKNSLYVEVKDKETRSKCTPVVQDVAGVLRGIIEFYEDQIRRYKEALKEVNNGKD